MSEDQLNETVDPGGQVLIYQSPDTPLQVEVRVDGQMVWLTQQQMADLFQVTRENVRQHIRNIYDEGELEEKATSKDFLEVCQEGQRMVRRSIAHYNLDMIISLGCRVKSETDTQFRQRATEQLKEYLVKGFTLDDQRLKNLGDGSYWYELLERIRDIRSSEKVVYRQVLDLYATSMDYDPKSVESMVFFKMVQNKLHYASHGHTAAEVIYERADATQPFMGLTMFRDDLPVLAEDQAMGA